MPRLMRFFLALACLPAALAAQDGRPAAILTLEDAIAIGQRQGPDARAAVSARDRAVFANRAFRARLLPQVSLAGNAPSYTRAIDVVQLDDGTRRFVPAGAVESNLNLRVEQLVPQAGGAFYVQSGLSRLDLLGDVNGEARYWNSTPFAVGFRQDFFRPRETLWLSRRQRLEAEVAERRWLESRETVAGTVVDRYFDAWAARVAATNAATNAAVNDTLYTLNKGRFEVGRIGENELLQSELALLRARAAVDGARLQEARSLAALRIALDLPVATPVELVPPAVLRASVAPDTTIAVQQALRNRSRMVELDLAAVGARYDVTRARLLNGFNAAVTAEVGFNQTSTAFGSAYENLLNQQRARVSIDMPLWQWGAGRNEIAAAEAERDRVGHVARRTRAEVEQEAHFAALQFALSERMLQIAAKADTVGTKRFDVARQRYIIGRIGVTELYIAQTEKDAALDAYVRALRAYWRDWYRLRELTLWDFATGAPVRGD